MYRSNLEMMAELGDVKLVEDSCMYLKQATNLPWYFKLAAQWCTTTNSSYPAVVFVLVSVFVLFLLLWTDVAVRLNAIR